MTRVSNTEKRKCVIKALTLQVENRPDRCQLFGPVPAYLRRLPSV